MMKKVAICMSLNLFLIGWNVIAHAQQNTGIVYGILQYNSGQPVSGATVTIAEKPDVQSISNSKGIFEIKGKPGQHLQINGVNQSAKEVLIRRDTIKITFNNNRSIPIGFGLTRSLDGITSAVGIVRANNLPVNSSFNRAGNMLVGKVPSLETMENSVVNLEFNRYSPIAPVFLVRGIATTFGSAGPLVIVDGFQAPMNSVVPEAIQSVSVLKDAAAEALYGQRGANGVIVVKTKRGTDQPLEVHASYNEALTKPSGGFPPHFVNSYTYAKALNEARANDGLTPAYNKYDLKGFKTGSSPYFYPNINWFNETLRNHGIKSNVNADFAGGDSHVRYFALLHYMHKDGLLGPVHTNSGYGQQWIYAQFNFLSNLDINLTNTTLLKLNISARLSRINRPHDLQTMIISNLFSVPSAAYPIKTPDGHWGGSQQYAGNPVGNLEARGYNIPDLREVIIGGKLRQKLDAVTPGLSAELDINYHNFGSYFQQHFAGYQYEQISPVRNNAGMIVDTSKTLLGTKTAIDYYSAFEHLVRQGNLRGKLNYEKSFGNNNVKALLMYEQERYASKGLNTQYNYRNFGLNVHYGLKDTYFFDIAATGSGRNHLPAGNRYHFFPTVSGAWLLSNGGFLKGASFLNRLKLRASWGISGANNLPLTDPYKTNYTAGGTYYFTDNVGTGFGGYHEDRLPSSVFTPSRQEQTNIGIDARLFGHLSLTADVFYQHRTHILTSSAGFYSGVIGIPTPTLSNGIVDNKGLDGSLKWQQTIGNVAWYIGGQVTWTRNKIVNENEPVRPYNYLKRTGREVGQIFGLRVKGFFKDQKDIDNSPQQVFSPVKPGDIKYEDVNHDGVIDQYDEVPMGWHTGYPDLYYSASIGFKYKGISLSALFQGVGQMTAYLNTKSVYWPLGADNNSISTYYYNHRWTPQTASTATLPRLTTEDSPNNFRTNSIWLVNGSFLKLRDVKLSYTLPTALVNKLRMDEITFVARGRNLVSWDHIPVGDPEQYGAGYPLLRFYSLGVNIGF
jgi:TonB-linked SusC/RagA family outer membrane protein